jgi:hypothetical protein
MGLSSEKYLLPLYRAISITSYAAATSKMPRSPPALAISSLFAIVVDLYEELSHLVHLRKIVLPIFDAV